METNGKKQGCRRWCAINFVVKPIGLEFPIYLVMKHALKNYKYITSKCGCMVAVMI